MALPVTASFNGQHAGVHGRIAYQLPQDGWYLKPYLDLHAIWQCTEAYTESGAGALDLSVSSSSATQLVASPMLKLCARFASARRWCSSRCCASAAVSSARTNGTPRHALPARRPPHSKSATLPTALFNLNLGVTLMSGDKLHLRLDYSGQFGSDYRSNGGSLKVSYFF